MNKKDMRECGFGVHLIGIAHTDAVVYFMRIRARAVYCRTQRDFPICTGVRVAQESEFIIQSFLWLSPFAVPLTAGFLPLTGFLYV